MYRSVEVTKNFELNIFQKQPVYMLTVAIKYIVWITTAAIKVAPLQSKRWRDVMQEVGLFVGINQKLASIPILNAVVMVRGKKNIHHVQNSRRCLPI